MANAKQRGIRLKQTQMKMLDKLFYVAYLTNNNDERISNYVFLEGEVKLDDDMYEFIDGDGIQFALPSGTQIKDFVVKSLKLNTGLIKKSVALTLSDDAIITITNVYANYN